MCMPSIRSCLPALNQTEEQINFGGLKMVCSTVEIKHFPMFIHVHFVHYVNMKRRSVHVFELRQYSDLSLKSHKKVFIVRISFKMSQFKS